MTQDAASRAAELRKFVNVSPVVIEGEPNAHQVTFDVESQHFFITPHGCDDKEHAEWFADMFVKALCKAFKSVEDV